MYKIYINGTPLFLTSTKDFIDLKLTGDNLLKNRYGGKKKYLHNYIDLLEKNKNFDAVVLHFPRVEQLWKDFQKIYKIEKASGGVIEDEDGKILMIFRRGFWDLPKGKIEKGESREAAAVREVEEETGAQNIDLQDLIHITYHTFINNKDKRVLKITYWYAMKTKNQKLLPQAEEDIEIAEFMDLETFFSSPKKIYGNILDTLSAFRKSR